MGETYFDNIASWNKNILLDHVFISKSTRKRKILRILHIQPTQVSFKYSKTKLVQKCGSIILGVYESYKNLSW